MDLSRRQVWVTNIIQESCGKHTGFNSLNSNYLILLEDKQTLGCFRYRSENTMQGVLSSGARFIVEVITKQQQV